MRKARLPAALLAAILLGPGMPLHAGDGHDHHHADHHADADTRVAIPLTAREKHFLLSEMRQFLGVTQRILQATTDGNMPAVAEAARSVGLTAHRHDFANQESIVHGIRRKAPQAFLPLGRDTHAAFDEIADIAAEFGDRDLVQRRLADNLQRCVACHAAYRITDAPGMEVQ